MSTKSFIECDQRGLEKLKKYQLPHRFKKIGLGIFIISLVSLFLLLFTTDITEFKQVAKYGMLIGLLLIAISKEKIEDELVINLRTQAFTIAFIIGVVYALTAPFADYLFDFILGPDGSSFEGAGDFMILWILLSMQVFYFEVLKRAHR